MIGPNTLPTRSVPCRWNMNSTNRIASVIATTYCLNSGVATSSPSIAPRTEIAGVMTPSP